MAHWPRSDWTDERVLMVVKTYPNPSAKYIETVCTAGIRENSGFVRLHPVRFRLLAQDKRFSKYTWVRVPIKKTEGDRRPESFRPDIEKMRLEEKVGTKNQWEERKRIILPLLSPSIEDLQDRQAAHGTSLGVIKPREVIEFTISPSVDPDWSADDLAKLQRQDMFEEAQRWMLEKIPFEFRYRFLCDDPRCAGHHFRVWDWEVAQSYRSWRLRYPGPGKLEAALVNKYQDELIHKRDLHFFVGTIAEHPRTWTIIGLFYPPKQH